MAGVIERFQKDWLTIQQAQTAMRCSKSTILRRLRDNTLAKCEVFGRTFVSRESVERYLKAALSVTG